MTTLQIVVVVLIVIIGIGIGLALGYKYRKDVAEGKIGTAEVLAAKIIDDANNEADTLKKEVLLEAKDEIHAMREKQEREYDERRKEVSDYEARLQKRESDMDKRAEKLDRQSQSLNSKIENAENREKRANELVEEQEAELSRISELSKEEAKNIIIDRVREDAVHESAQVIREYEEKVKDESKKIARDIIITTIQRYASDFTADSTVSVVSLPNDDMKGRIIGREGRNIRAFETITGVDLIIDDTPEAVVISSFNPIRREIARIALEKLIQDGRIHPTRIEEIVEKANEEVDEEIKEAGEDALDAVGIHNVHPKLVKHLGKLKYRTSYGQNVLKHTVEVSNIAGMLAEELGADAKLARRGGLFHDIGKAVDFETEGTHVELGAKLLRRYKEDERVINCVTSHHGDEDFMTLEAMLVEAADSISAARPGARRESIENYVRRLEDLENIASSFDGVEKAYAIQAGREIRVMIEPDQVSEDKMTILAHDIAKQIEEQLEYPGQIKVNVIRETRTTDYAK